MQQDSRLPYLDSLRGLAAFSVYLSHYFGAYGSPVEIPSWVAYTPLIAFHDGFAAVSLFFVLSGLVLSLKFFHGSQKNQLISLNSLASFYVARLARVYLPFLAILAVCAAMRHWSVVSDDLLPRSSWIGGFWNYPETTKNLFKQILLFRPTLPDQERLIPMDWTLSIELNLSFWVPFLILIARSGLAALLLFTLAGTLFLGAPIYLWHFSLGIGIAKTLPLIRPFLDKRMALKTTVFIFAVLLYPWVFVKTSLSQLSPVARESWIWWVTGLGSSLTLVTVLANQRLQTFLRLRFLTFLGRISFSLYLIHFPILRELAPWISHWLPLSPFLCFGINTLVVIVLSWISYQWIEVPCIQVGKYLASRSKLFSLLTRRLLPQNAS